ncbi:HAD-IIIC family phosphatase, partial [Bradyrhizobium sp.]|uniref:HAD-IIIC family phosphatase n=1 Tax=Bradyrhizobium sp. TaxID=376 RepID=UPI003C5F89B8
MRLRRSSFVHQIPLAPNSVLLVHAISQLRLKVDDELARLISYFSEWREFPAAFAELRTLLPYEDEIVAATVNALRERDLLTENSGEEELAGLAQKLAPTHGRDPEELLDRYRRELKEGTRDYWSVKTSQTIGEVGVARPRLDLILFGDCDVHMEADFLRREADRRGYDLRVAATSPDDFAFAAEHRHDAVLIGALHARHFITMAPMPGGEPHEIYIAQARDTLLRLREKTSAPILIDNLPEPTVQPLGIAERGRLGHRTRFRSANVALAELADLVPDVHVVDVAAALAAEGGIPLIDDWQVGFTHMGSPGWMLQRADSEKAAVYDLLPEMESLIGLVHGDPYRREAVVARTHVDTLFAALGLGRKKCVIVDLDNTLWPGVLAETGAPFAWQPSISGVFSFIGLYFGLHEALLCLKKRGIVLACVSKNDETVVRDLWKYPDSYPRERLLTLDDFVTHRINWNDKADNIRSIAEELGFARDSFIFVDDNPVERERVRRFLPEVEVWGEDLLGLRRALLTDSRLQVAHVTDESARRTELVKAQLGRRRLQAEAADEPSYIASLQIQTRIERLRVDTDSKAKFDAKFDRIEELFRRTTQFNATGRLFTAPELRRLAQADDAQVFALDVSDRFADHGLVGAAVIEAAEITGLVMSCRVLGLGIEHEFVRHILAVSGAHRLSAKIIPTARNIPVRNIYRDNGFG